MKKFNKKNLKSRIKFILSNYLIFRFFHAKILNWFNYPLFNYDSIHKKLSKTMPWDEGLFIPVKKLHFDYVPNASTYSIGITLKKFAGFNGKLVNTVIAHGAFLVGYELRFVSKFALNKLGMGKRMGIAFSSENPNSSKKYVAIGPYINYARPFWSIDYHNKLKIKFKKTLVVFLPHGNTIKKGYMQMSAFLYTPELVIKRLKKYYKDYDTIIVCGCARSYPPNYKNTYEDAGFTFVLSGQPNDPYFLSRQKSIMELADHSLSFTFSTHVGYFLSLGISHEIINLFNKDHLDHSNNRSFTNRRINLNLIDDYDQYRYQIENSDFQDYPEIFYYESELEILRSFFNTGDKILEEQLEILEDYFGFKELKSPEQLLKHLK